RLSSILLRLRTTSSTLFPYTTLFRSRAGEQGLGGVRDAAEDLIDDVVPGVDRQVADFVIVDQEGVGDVDRRTHLGEGGAGTTSSDRKSTRLNSSHQIISYAVFCLTKK